ncbi:MAG: hypothetical protein ACOYM3_10260 [Terrimicrobiaceae bacterium]
MKEDWDHDQLWDLLGNTKPVQVSPFFSRNVLRRIRQASARPLVPVFVLRWLGAGAFALLTAGFFLNLGDASHGQPVIAKSADFTEIFDVAAGLDTLVAVEDVSVSNYAAGL